MEFYVFVILWSNVSEKEKKKLRTEPVLFSTGVIVHKINIFLYLLH